MEREQKERVEHLVNVYISYRMSPTHEAGWHGESTLGRLVEFKGDIPPPSGNDQADLKMINEMRYLQGEHYDLPQAKRVLFLIDKKYRDAIISKIVCRNRWYASGKMLIKCDDAYITKSLQIDSVSAYRKRVQRAYEQIIELDTKTARYCA